MDFQVGDERALPGIDDHATGTKGKLHNSCMLKFSPKIFTNFFCYFCSSNPNGVLCQGSARKFKLNFGLSNTPSIEGGTGPKVCRRFEWEDVVVVDSGDNCNDFDCHWASLYLKKLFQREKTKPNELRKTLKMEDTANLQHFWSLKKFSEIYKNTKKKSVLKKFE